MKVLGRVEEIVEGSYKKWRKGIRRGGGKMREGEIRIGRDGGKMREGEVRIGRDGGKMWRDR